VGLLVNTTPSSVLNVARDLALIHFGLTSVFRLLLSQQASSLSFKPDYTTVNPGQTLKSHICWRFTCFTSQNQHCFFHSSETGV